MASSEYQIRSEISEVMNELTDADLVFEITAKPSRNGPRILPRTEPIEQALEATLRAFAATLETHVEKVAVLEEVSKSCVTIWFRFEAFGKAEADSDASKTADPALLKYVAQALLTILSWMEGRSELRLSDLQQALRVLAWGTSATSRAHPALPTSIELARAVAAWRSVKEGLRDSASARLILQQGSVELDLCKPVPELTSLVDKKLVNGTVEMILLVERPDYGATGEWLFKHGQSRFAVQCSPCDALDRFYRRELDIRPGDALHCKVEFGTAYGPDHEVVEEKLSVLDVLEVLSACPVGNGRDGRSEARSGKRKPADEVKDRMLIL